MNLSEVRNIVRVSTGSFDINFIHNKDLSNIDKKEFWTMLADDTTHICRREFH